MGHINVVLSNKWNETLQQLAGRLVSTDKKHITT